MLLGLQSYRKLLSLSKSFIEALSITFKVPVKVKDCIFSGGNSASFIFACLLSVGGRMGGGGGKWGFHSFNRITPQKQIIFCKSE